MSAQIDNDKNIVADNLPGNSRTYAMVDHLLNMLSVGIACVRKNGELMYANQAAINMLTRCNVLQTNTHHPEGKIGDATLKKLFLNVNQTAVIRQKEIELQIQVEPFINANNGQGDEIERREGAMLILREAGAIALPCPEQLKSMYTLTQAEARLALKLCAGESPIECAESLNLGITTIRTQLRALMDKTESHRQSEMLTKLLSIPSTSIRTT